MSDIREKNQQCSKDTDTKDIMYKGYYLFIKLIV